MGRFGASSALAMLLLVLALPGESAETAKYVGPKTCALCHKDIAAKQEQTAMANTWQGRVASWLPSNFSASISDGLSYRFDRTREVLLYSATDSNGPTLKFPVDISMGGRRHGLGFLIRVDQVDGNPLARSTLVQTRYAWSPEHNRLLLAPGCASGKPETLEASLGLVLSPTFENRCLACHGQPGNAAAGHEGGVHCESCHGPGSSHVSHIGQHDSDPRIINPKRLSAKDSMAVCAQCHVGLTRFSDPSPDDLLIANQVRAIRSSECFLQSGEAFSCTACHDPHSDTSGNDSRAVNTCLGCHSQSAKPRAAICPVNAKSNCIACHMPSVDKGPLHLVDHLIRVHPEQGLQAQTHNADWDTQSKPISEYLRMLVTDNPSTAAFARTRIVNGESFYAVAHESSMDKTAAIGGYLGRKTLAELDPQLASAAAQLRYGQTSSIIQTENRWVLLQRLPRDFRWQAEQLEEEAETLLSKGEAAAAIGKAQAALMIYPHYLRALHLIGITFARTGNPKKAVDVLRVAAELYPNDGATQFQLGSALSATADINAASSAYEKAIALEPDFVAAYLELGLISFNRGDWANAIHVFRQGLHIDPMCADLYYDLSLALARNGDATGARVAMALARNLDPQLGSVEPDTATPRRRSDSF